MSTAALDGPVTNLAPVVDDRSVFLIAGRVKTVPRKGYEAAGQYGIGEFSPVREQAIEAERLGFAGVWLSELST